MRVWISTLVALALAAAVPVGAAAQPAQPSPPEVPGSVEAVEIRTPELFADYHEAEPATASPGAVIVLGGSEGGIQSATGIARRLAEAGFSSLAVSYFGSEGQSTVLNEIPLEQMTAARAWLEARPGQTGGIAIIGASKGAELALLTASRDPAIRAVVAGVPSSVVWQGVDMSGGPTGSSWTSGGEALAYVPYDFSRGFRGIYQLYADSLPGAPEAAVIPVERINGPVMLISGDADGLWPSADMAGRIVARLEQNGFAYAVENLTYPGAGHAAFGPPLQNTTLLTQQLAFLGGTVEGTVAAREDSWPRVLAFLRAALAQP